MRREARTSLRERGASLSAYSTPALEKGLDVLELLARQPAGLTKSEIARELRRSISEIFRMLLCLEARGYIAHFGDDRYSLTLRLFQLAQEHPPSERLITDALPVMHRLAQQTLQSCHLGVLEAGRVVILAQVNAPANLGFYVRPGSTVDLMGAASGYTILAHLPDVQREHALAEWGQVTGRKPPRDLGAHLTRIRRAGYEKRASYVVNGVTNISFPILGERRSPIAALTVPYIEYTKPVKSVREVVAALREAAGELTASFGGTAAS